MNKLTKNKKVFGAIIVNFNSYDFLDKCVKSICCQETHFSKIIIVDNSTLEKPDIPIFPRNCKYIRMKYNSGFAKANNIGLKHLNGCDWVALINPDVILTQDWLSKMNLAISENPQFSFFACRLLNAKRPSIIDGLGDKYHVSGFAWRHLHGKENIPNYRRHEVFSACAAAAFYRYDALIEVGGFDEDFFCYFEDVDLCFRLQLAGHRGMVIPDSVAYHYCYQCTGDRHSNFALFYGHRNIVWTYCKNMPFLLFIFFLPLHIMLNIFCIFRFLLIGKGKVVFRSKIASIRSIKKCFSKRKEIQSKRISSCKTLIKLFDKHFIPYA